MNNRMHKYTHENKTEPKLVLENSPLCLYIYIYSYSYIIYIDYVKDDNEISNILTRNILLVWVYIWRVTVIHNVLYLSSVTLN